MSYGTNPKPGPLVTPSPRGENLSSARFSATSRKPLIIMLKTHDPNVEGSTMLWQRIRAH